MFELFHTRGTDDLKLHQHGVTIYPTPPTIELLQSMLLSPSSNVMVLLVLVVWVFRVGTVMLGFRKPQTCQFIVVREFAVRQCVLAWGPGIMVGFGQPGT